MPPATRSRNNFWLALITLGEGWHNTTTTATPMSTRQGFYWWEVDITYYGLRLLAAWVVWDLKPVRAEVRDAHTAVAS